MTEVRRWAIGLWKTLISPDPGTFKELGRLGEEKPIASLVVLSFALLVLYLVSFYSPGTSISIMDMILTMITGVLMIASWVAITHFLYQRMFHRKEVVFNQLLCLVRSLAFPIVLRIDDSAAEVQDEGVGEGLPESGCRFESGVVAR